MKWDLPLETWVLGAILALVGFLVIGCSLAQSELEFPLIVAGTTSTSVGSCIFFFKFKKWIENL